MRHDENKKRKKRKVLWVDVFAHCEQEKACWRRSQPFEFVDYILNYAGIIAWFIHTIKVLLERTISFFNRLKVLRILYDCLNFAFVPHDPIIFHKFFNFRIWEAGNFGDFKISKSFPGCLPFILYYSTHVLEVGAIVGRPFFTIPPNRHLPILFINCHYFIANIGCSKFEFKLMRVPEPIVFRDSFRNRSNY